MEPNEILSKIGELAPVVAQEHEALCEAIKAEQSAEAALLERAIKMAKPALRALSSRFKSYKRWGATNGLYPWEKSETFAWRGVKLAGGRDDNRYPGDQNRGSYHGTSLFLSSEGTLIEVEWSGSWSHWQGEANEYEGQDTMVTVESVVADWSIDTILSNLHEALTKQTGTRAGATKAGMERAKTIGAIVDLVGK